MENKSSDNNQKIVGSVIRINDLILQNVPHTIEEVPYARLWVQENIVHKLSCDEPLACVGTGEFKNTHPARMELLQSPRVKHFPWLEEVTLDLVKKVLPHINRALPTNISRLDLVNYIYKNAA